MQSRGSIAPLGATDRLATGGSLATRRGAPLGKKGARKSNSKPNSNSSATSLDHFSASPYRVAGTLSDHSPPDQNEDIPSLPLPSPPAKREGSGREGMLPAAFSWPARSRGAGRLPAHHKAGPATRGSVGPVFPQVASNHSGRRKSRRTGEVPAQQCPGIGRPGALEPFIGGMVQNAGARITAVSTSHYSRESFGLGSLRWAEPSSAELKGARADFNRGVVTVLTSSPTASLVHAVLASRA